MIFLFNNKTKCLAVKNNANQDANHQRNELAIPNRLNLKSQHSMSNNRKNNIVTTYQNRKRQ